MARNKTAKKSYADIMGYVSGIVSSFKDERLLYVFLIDLIFVMVIMFSYNLWSSSFFAGVEQTDFNIQSLQDEISAGAQIDPDSREYMAIKAFRNSAIYTSILFFMFFFISFIVSRLMIWLIILKKDYNFKIVMQFFLLNIIWLPLNAIIFSVAFLFVWLLSLLVSRLSWYMVSVGIPSAVSFIIYSTLVIIVLLPLALFFFNLTNILYLSFLKTGMIKSSFVILAEMITGNISALFKAYVLHGLLLYTLFVVTYFIKSGNVFLNVLLLAVFLLFASWSKLYVYTAVSKG